MSWAGVADLGFGKGNRGLLGCALRWSLWGIGMGSYLAWHGNGNGCRRMDMAHGRAAYGIFSRVLQR